MGPVTPIISRFRRGSKSAFADLFTLFYSRQVRQAESELGGVRSLCEGEDIALSAFQSLWREVTSGKFPGKLDDTKSFLAFLHLLTTQKARRAKRYDRQRKRDVRKTVDLLDHAEPEQTDSYLFSLTNHAQDLPAAISTRQRLILQLLSEGWQRDEIAKNLGCGLRTVDRELASIRATIRDRDIN